VQKGSIVGTAEGSADSLLDGSSDGSSDGSNDGASEGKSDELFVGCSGIVIYILQKYHSIIPKLS